MITLEELEKIKTEIKRASIKMDYKTAQKALAVIDKYAEQEPCDDVVSRQDVLKAVDFYDGLNHQHFTVENLREDIERLPSVRPQEPKTGHWILNRAFPTKLYDEYLNEYKCSECYREIRCTESQLVNYPYCHCGAKMVEPRESEVRNEEM